MGILGITIFFLIASPISAYLIYRNTEKGSKKRKSLFKFSSITTIVIVSMTQLGVSTISQTVDWIILGFTLFLLYTIAWLVFDMSLIPKIIRTLIGIGLFISISISLISCTIGLLGTAFIIGDYDFKSETMLSDTIVYREFLKGNAISDYRLKEIVILRRPKYLPFLEFRIAKRKYFDWNLVFSKFEPRYNVIDDLIEIEANIKTDSTEVRWKDNIYINKKD